MPGIHAIPTSIRDQDLGEKVGLILSLARVSLKQSKITIVKLRKKIKI